jgi:hypothetical protein
MSARYSSAQLRLGIEGYVSKCDGGEAAELTTLPGSVSLVLKSNESKVAINAREDAANIWSTFLQRKSF